MNRMMDKVELWPRNKAHEPIFTSSEDAVFYGALISRHKPQISELKQLRTRVYYEIELEKKRKAPSLQKIMNLAVKGQFFREAYEEAERLNDYYFSLK